MYANMSPIKRSLPTYIASYSHFWSYISKIQILFAVFTSNFMTVRSFQSSAVSSGCWPGNEYCTRTNSRIHICGDELHSKDVEQVEVDANEKGLGNIFHLHHESLNRRGFFHSISLTLGMALAVLERPSNANGAEVTSEVDTSATTTSNAMFIPFSSVRDQKVITLSNGLQVLLVNDKLASQSKAALLVEGAGQFTEYDDLPGSAHLMEHMILSSNSNPKYSSKGDLEEWLNDNDGASNAFTAYDHTCFHFNCPHHIFPEALERFGFVFEEANIIDVCRNSEILAREIRRVDSELDLKSIFAQLEFVTKAFVNPEHPYTKSGRGSLKTLETNAKGINVGQRLIDFFRQRYLPSRTVLVVISNQQDLLSMQRWVAPFNVALSKQRQPVPVETHYPGRFLRGRQRKHLILYDNSPSISTAGKEKLIIQWVLNEDYTGPRKTNAVEIAFVLNQIFGRRGPGSLYIFLRGQGWIQNGPTLPLQVKVPINVSGFQILKLELALTLDGFLNRSKVVAAIYDYIEVLRTPGTKSFVIPRGIMAQYATTAKLFGYILAPRPPDAVELAIDSMNYGVDTVNSGKWYRFPSTEDLGGLGLNRMRRAVSRALVSISDPENALIIVTAGAEAIAMTRTAFAKYPIPPITSSKWKKERTSGAQVYFEDMLESGPWIGQAFLTTAVNPQEEFLPPVYNPFELTSLRPTRSSNMIQFSSISKENNDTWSSQQDDFRRRNWIVLTPTYRRMALPRAPPETDCRCLFVLQLLSSRTTTATAEQAANGELWKLSFDAAATDLAELGAPGGLAYELKFNKYGLRLSFLGLGRTIPSYARRMTQLLVRFQQNLLKGPKTLPKSLITTALADASRSRALSPAQRRIVTDTIQKASTYDVVQEGTAFLDSCKGAVCFSEGDLTQSETENLMDDLQKIVGDSIGAVEQQEIVAIPSADELVDTPNWKPRNASPCYIVGVSLMCDACGRVPR